MITAIRPVPAAVTVRVPAKVNLQLAVGPARDDGYHPLVTVFHAVSLNDEVTVRPAAKMALAVSGEDASADRPSGPPGSPNTFRPVSSVTEK